MRLLCKIYEWLAVSETPQLSDVIFVLAGRECRKIAGLKLFRDGLACRLLLSVGRFEIRRFCGLDLPVAVNLVAASSLIAPPIRHFFVAFERGKATVERVALLRLGTWSEVNAFADWLEMRPHVRSATVISSGFHLRRIRLCCRLLVPERVELSFFDIQEELVGLDRNQWWRNVFARRLMLLELFKLFLYWCVCHRPSRKGAPGLISG
jgi:hypothetical protein